MAGASEVRIEEEKSSTPNISAVADTITAMLGITEKGPIGEAKQVASFPEWQRIFGGYTSNNLAVVASVEQFFANGGKKLVFGRVVHVGTPGDPSTKTSAKASLNLSTAAGAATAAYAESNVQPFDLQTSGKTLSIYVDGGGIAQTITFSAVAAALQCANSETYALTNGMTLLVKIDGGSAQTITFATASFANIGAATAEEVAAVINAALIGGRASATSDGAKVTITSDKLGTGSSVQVTGGTSNSVLGFSTSLTSGTGSVADIRSVTAAEVVTLLDAIEGSGFTPSVTSAGKVRITSDTTGDNSSIIVDESSTADSLIGFDNALHYGRSGSAVPTLTVEGKYDGTYAHELSIRIVQLTTTTFDLYVLRNGLIKERWLNLSMDSTSDRYAITIINNEYVGSTLISLTDLNIGAIPAEGTSSNLSGGSDGLGSLDDTDYIGSEGETNATGLRVLDEFDIDILAIPGIATAAVHNAMITYCEVTRSGLVFPVCDPPEGYTPEQLVDYVKTTASLFELSELGAMYYPRIKVANPNKALFGSASAVVIPNSGMIAGLMVANDSRKIGAIFSQPAGIDGGVGVPKNVLGLESNYTLKKTARDLLCNANINPISKEKGTPFFIDGAMTFKSTGNWPSVGQRRGVSFVEKKLISGLAFMRHQNIKKKLRERGKNATTEFLLSLTLNEAFASKNPNEAFFVDFGDGINNSMTSRAKTVYGIVGLNTSNEAQFIVITISPDNRQYEKELAALMAA